MPIETILLIILAAIIALGFSFLKYFFGIKNKTTTIYSLAFFRFLTVFILLIILINPEIKQTEFEIQKPQLFIAVDNSASMEYLGVGEEVVTYFNYIKNHPGLQEKFDISSYGFGEELYSFNKDSASFNKSQSNITGALKSLSKIHIEGQDAIILISDGNQTVGEDFQYFKPGKNLGIFPVVAGDTTSYSDLFISNLNVNKYAFLNNNFPVEFFLNYTGKDAVSSKFEIRSGASVLYSKTFNFNSEKPTEVLTTTLPANNLGVRTYTAEISPVEGEKNTINNSKNFGIEVIDERSSVLIISSISHPDLGMFKESIESNEQRQAEVISIKNINNSDISDFQLIILYQPNNKFNPVFEEINNKNLNYLLVTGTQTDWNFINSILPFSKNFTSQNQDFIPIYNSDFSLLQFEDIGFSNFPPLVDVFGNWEFQNQNYNTLLFQQVEGIPTTSPLLAAVEDESNRYVLLFGENIWRWRAQSYIEKGSFEAFDSFFGKLVQYLASTQKKDRLVIDAESFFSEDEEITISAQYFDQNYQFDPSGDLILSIENSATNEKLETSMLLSGKSYFIKIDNLTPGEYVFEVRESNSGLSRNGKFTVLEYNVEQQFSSANISKLKNFALSANSRLYYLDTPDELITQLLEDTAYVSVQKSHEKNVPLINWMFLLALLVFSLGAEWFTRKYIGLI